MEEKPSKFEWVILIIFIISGFAIFFYRVNIHPSEISQLTTVLLSTFEILLSLYVGYFLQRLDSAKQSRENLKKYGFLAYRRIMDIKKSINRLFNEIARINSYLPREKVNEIKVLHSILEGTFDTVESSVLDWVDIIGEEISKKEKVEKLQEELSASQRKANLSEKDKGKLEEIRSELEKLRSEIPSFIRISNGNDEKFIKYNHYISEQVQRDGYIILPVKIVLDLPLSSKNTQKIVRGHPYLLRTSYRMGNLYIDVHSQDKQRLGYIVSSIASDKEKYKSGIPNTFSNQYEDDNEKNYFLAFDNVFALDVLENDEGFCTPAKCEFKEFVDTDYFNIIFSSELFPRA